MSIEYIDHINISGPEDLLRKVVCFYVDVLGLEVGDRPTFRRSGYWLYAAGRPIIHLTEGSDKEPGQNTYLDHVAFRANGLMETKRRIESQKVEYHEKAVKDLKQVQLFLMEIGWS